MMLIKNNHLAAAGGVRAAMDRVKLAGVHYIKVEVEVESEADLREAIACGADVIMLDNQDVASLKQLVEVARGHQARCGARSLRRRVSRYGQGRGRDRSGPHIHQRAHHGSAPPVDVS